MDTPFKTNFMPSRRTFHRVQPERRRQTASSSTALRAHATAGRAFVPPDAGALTGFTTTIVGGRTQINQGNPDLKPEHSVSVDAGARMARRATHVDVTYFHTTVNDRVVSNVLISSPPPPAPIVLSAVNTLAAHIYGMDVDVEHRLDTAVSLFSNITHYFSRREQLPTTGERNILNVADQHRAAGVDLDLGRVQRPVVRPLRAGAPGSGFQRRG